MTFFSKRVPWFGMGMAFVLILSLALHFWGLSRFNLLVFDEIYYVKYARNYLTHTPFFDAHPPLGKYAIALGILLGKFLPFGKDTVNNLAGVELSPFTYRWLDALTGSLLPLIVGGIAYQLTHRRSYALIAALFTTCDGLFLVESRYALINIYLVFFGLLGQYLFLLALEKQGGGRWFWLALAGICFGASFSVKWNGLAFLLGIYLIWICAWVIRILNPNQDRENDRNFFPLPTTQFPLKNLTQINLLQITVCLGIIPAILYYLVWIPHLQINSEMGFVELHQQILGFHQRMKNTKEVHPYCSNWYTWPLMVRPIVYLYEVVSKTDLKPSLPPLPAGTDKAIFDVHAMGNPALWWLSAIAILLLIGELAKRLWVWVKTSGNLEQNLVYFPQQKELWCVLYLVLNYATNLLPWVKVTRCTFIYLYMGGAIFAFLSLAWLVERWLHSLRPRLRGMGITVIFLILISFVFWLPVYLGLPLSTEDLQIRMWFRSWI